MFVIYSSRKIELESSRHYHRGKIENWWDYEKVKKKNKILCQNWLNPG